MAWRRVLKILVWLALLAGAVVAVGLALLFYRPEAARFPSAEPLPPARVQEAEKRIGEVRQEADRVARSVQENRPTPFTFRLRDEDLNTYFAAHPEELRALHPDLQAVEIRFRQGAAVSFRALGTYRGREMVLRAEGKVSLVEGSRLHFTVQEARLGALPLPGGLRKELAQGINQGLAQQMKQLPPRVRLESLSSAEGELILQGQVTGTT
jgi:hypothetical protein